MRQTTTALILVVLLSLFYAPEVLGGGGFAGDLVTGKVGPPAVSATIVIDPTFGSPTKGRTSIRLQKSTSVSGATFIHKEAAQPLPVGWVLGCDSVNGANPLAFGVGAFNVNTLTDLRFLNVRLRSWIPNFILTALFGQLGIPIDPDQVTPPFPVITDVDAPVCTEADRFIAEDLVSGGGNGDGICNPDGSNPNEVCVVKPKHILSFTATIQFEK